MADAFLPPISTGFNDSSQSRQTPTTRKNLVPRQGSSVGTPNSTTLPLFQVNEGVTVDEKLNEQFRYFRTEYVEAANTSGVAVPLVIVEDKSGQVYKFVLHGGPKYLFEVIQANLENIHLLRCSLSLLIIIITVLRRKLPDPSQPHRESTLFSVNTTDSITSWVVDTLAKIGDAAAVSVCINILITTYNPSVQELSLSLLASILMVSDEAVAQMLLPYNPTGAAVVIDSSALLDTARRNSGKRTSSRPSSVEANDPAMRNSTEIIYEQKPSVDFKKLNFSYNTMDYSAKKAVVKEVKKVEKVNSCLSYVLSVILLQKNRHLLAAGCADIILAMLRKNRRDMCENIAQSPTCELPAIDERKSKNDNRKLSYNPQPEETTPQASNPLSNVIIDWAGLKLLLKFLFRYEKMNAQSKTATRAIVRESVSASLHLKEEYAYAHGRVFTAVCQLIAGSPEVAAHANTLQGAEELLTFTYNRFDSTDTNAYNCFVAAANALQSDRQHQARRRAAHSPDQHHVHKHDSSDVRLSEYMSDPNASHVFTVPRSKSPLLNQGHGNHKTPSSNVSPPKNTSNRFGKNAKNKMAVSMDAGRNSSGRLGTEPRQQVQSQSIELARNMKVNFQSEYAVETEKRELYLINSYDAKYNANANSDLKKLSKEADLRKAQTPLHYNPQVDNLLDASLERIGNTALKPVTIPRPTMTEEQRREQEFLLGTPQGSSSPMKSLPTTVNTRSGDSVAMSNDSSSYPGRQYRDSDEEVIFANSQEFFSAIGGKPVIPKRIEPKDVITPQEDLTRIRDKFKQMADTALSNGQGTLALFLLLCIKIHHTSYIVCNFVNHTLLLWFLISFNHRPLYHTTGKTKAESERNSQQELIRRVYGPRKFKFFDPTAPAGQEGQEHPNKGHGKKNGKSRSRSPSAGRARSPGGPPPIEEGDLFASFSDASGRPLQDLPIQGRGGGKESNVTGLEGMDFSIEIAPFVGPSSEGLHSYNSFGAQSSTASEGPEVYGLRLENFDFDEQNLFDGFKPIFGNAVKESEKPSDSATQAAMKELGIGRKNKPDMEMAQTVDLILS